MLQSRYYPAPTGRLKLAAENQTLLAVQFAPNDPTPSQPFDSPFWQEVEAQFAAYFARKLRQFSLPFALTGTEFQKQVWQEVAKIPYGQTTSYAKIAETLNNPKSVRAVGAANGANPLPIIIPCHRVVGANGNLTGYAGGLPMKQALLTLEGVLNILNFG